MNSDKKVKTKSAVKKTGKKSCSVDTEMLMAAARTAGYAYRAVPDAEKCSAAKPNENAFDLNAIIAAERMQNYKRQVIEEGQQQLKRK